MSSKARKRRARGRGRTAMTDQQRRKLFALADERGMDLDALRACTPAGSVSMLTRREASMLIGKLAGGADAAAAERRDRATPRQLELIGHLAGYLRMDHERLGAWMGPRFGVASLKELHSREVASRIIQGLLRMWRAYQVAGEAGAVMR